MKPVINLDELELKHSAMGPRFEESWAAISERIGARRLGYSLSVIAPGKRICPYHNHRNNEEMFFILEGTGTLRFGGEEHPLRAMDVIACPPGGREVAHQIVNTGDVPMQVFCLSTMDPCEICEYPDSDKVGVFVGVAGKRDLYALFKADTAVDYMLGE